MTIVKPFRGIRPTKNLASKIAALPYDVMNSEEAREITKDNPYSFLHIDRAEVDLDKSIDIHDKRVYEKARDNLNNMINKGNFIQDEEAKFYIYRQIMKGKSQTGLVFVASIDDYINNVIKKHEFTRKDKEEDRVNHVDYCNANTGPIFLTYRENEKISNVINNSTKERAEYDFKSEDGVRHIVWVINNKEDIKDLENLFLKVDSMYIADGHHRSASAVRVGKMRREENPNYTGKEDFNYFLAVAFPHKDLNIMPYNRVVKDLGGFTTEEFLEKLSEDFSVTKYNGSFGVSPKEKHTFGMYLEGNWYILKARRGSFNKEDIIDSLDVSILNNNILKKILKIDDVRTSDRIDFVGGIRGLKELEKRTHEDMKVAFSMYETDIEDIMKISDIGKIMPPKSTWFEPKLRSGLFIHRI